MRVIVLLRPHKVIQKTHKYYILMIVVELLHFLTMVIVKNKGSVVKFRVM